MKSDSRSVTSYSLRPHELYIPWTDPGQNTGVGSLSLLQGIVPTQGSNPGLLHYWQILYQLSQREAQREKVGDLPPQKILKSTWLSYWEKEEYPSNK